MYGDSVCERCKKSFHWRRLSHHSIPKFCSVKCRYPKPTEEEVLFQAKKLFFSKIFKKENGCWGWNWFHTVSGYAQFRFNKINFRAHAFSYKIHKGEIPKGMQVNHLCDVRDCTNPDHLYCGTAKQNSDDMVRRDRHLRGSRNGRSKLNEDKVIEIKKMISQGKSCNSIAIKVGMSNPTILNIKNGKLWKHVPWPT